MLLALFCVVLTFFYWNGREGRSFAVPVEKYRRWAISVRAAGPAAAAGLDSGSESENNPKIPFFFFSPQKRKKWRTLFATHSLYLPFSFPSKANTQNIYGLSNISWPYLGVIVSVIRCRWRLCRSWVSSLPQLHWRFHKGRSPKPPVSPTTTTTGQGKSRGHFYDVFMFGPSHQGSPRLSTVLFNNPWMLCPSQRVQPSVKRHAMRPLRWKSSVLISFLLYRTSELVCVMVLACLCVCVILMQLQRLPFGTHTPFTRRFAIVWLGRIRKLWSFYCHSLSYFWYSDCMWFDKEKKRRW